MNLHWLVRRRNCKQRTNNFPTSSSEVFSLSPDACEGSGSVIIWGCSLSSCLSPGLFFVCEKVVPPEAPWWQRLARHAHEWEKGHFWPKWPWLRHVEKLTGPLAVMGRYDVIDRPLCQHVSLCVFDKHMQRSRKRSFSNIPAGRAKNVGRVCVYILAEEGAWPRREGGGGSICEMSCAYV